MERVCCLVSEIKILVVCTVTITKAVENSVLSFSSYFFPLFYSEPYIKYATAFYNPTGQLLTQAVGGPGAPGHVFYQETSPTSC